MEKRSKGFTLIEILLVIGILAVLSVVVFVALNPSQRLKDSKDSRRTTDVENILTAIHTYIVDNKGALPTGLTANGTETQLGTGASGCAISTGGCSVSATACTNLATPLTKYLKTIPVDPDGTDAATRYSVAVDTNGIVTVRACGAENSTISTSR